MPADRCPTSPVVGDKRTHQGRARLGTFDPDRTPGQADLAPGNLTTLAHFVGFQGDELRRLDVTTPPPSGRSLARELDGNARELSSNHGGDRYETVRARVTVDVHRFWDDNGSIDGRSRGMDNMTASPSNFIDRLFFGYQNSATLKASLELDVFTAIGEGSTDAAALAARCNAAPRGIVALCDSLVVMGFLTKLSGNYALSPDAALFLDRRSQMCIAGIHEFLAAPEMVTLAFQDPAGAVRRGGAPGLANVAPDHPIWVRFARAMGPFMQLDAKLVAEHAGGEPRRVLDISASHGLFGIAFGQRFPECHITGLDWSAVVAVARENADAAGMADRYDTIAGNAFEVAWGKDYDLVLLPNFLHHFDAASCTAILRRAHAALSPGGRVAIVEWVPNEDRISPPVPALFTMTMLLTTPAGTTYTVAELAAMLTDAGFGSPEVMPLVPTPLTLLVARAQ
jgi:O-methyltransferase domain/Dimerisation domain